MEIEAVLTVDDAIRIDDAACAVIQFWPKIHKAGLFVWTLTYTYIAIGFAEESDWRANGALLLLEGESDQRLSKEKEKDVTQKHSDRDNLETNCLRTSPIKMLYLGYGIFAWWTWLWLMMPNFRVWFTRASDRLLLFMYWLRYCMFLVNRNDSLVLTQTNMV